MSAGLPEIVDAWRMVASKRQFQGSLPLRELTRLGASLADDTGTVSYELSFSRDEFGTAGLDLLVRTELPLICQRTLERFAFPVELRQQLGLIVSEADEAALPPGFEPLLVPTGGELRLADVIEDELILALPVVPVKPGMEQEQELVWSSAPKTQDEPAEEGKPNPFAVLANLKKN